MNVADLQSRLRRVNFMSGLEAIVASHARYQEDIRGVLICDDQGNVLVDETTGQSLRHEADEEFLLDTLLYDQLPRQFFSGHEQLFVVRTMAVADAWCYDKLMEALHNIKEDIGAINSLHDTKRNERLAGMGSLSRSAIKEGRSVPPPNSCANCHEIGHISRQCPHPFCFDCKLSFRSAGERYRHSQEVHSNRPVVTAPRSWHDFEDHSTNYDDSNEKDLHRKKRDRSRTPPPPRYNSHLPPQVNNRRF